MHMTQFVVMCIHVFQVFSVRLRDRGPDYRGFVQLPLVQDQDGNPATVVDTSVLAQVGQVGWLSHAHRSSFT